MTVHWSPPSSFSRTSHVFHASRGQRLSTASMVASGTFVSGAS
nr:hypothetical protein [Terrabacter aerolatus]